MSDSSYRFHSSKQTEAAAALRKINWPPLPCRGRPPRGPADV